jgi:signal transduction histidine kinase
MNAQPHRQADIWERFDWLWDVILYVALLVSVVLMVLDDNRAAPIWLAATLSAVFAIWHAVGTRLAHRNLADFNYQPIYRFLVILVDIILWFVLVLISPAYYFALFGLFGQVFRHLPIRYAALAIVLLTAAIIGEQLGDSAEGFSLTNPTVWVFGFIGLAGIVLGVWVSAIIGQSTQRRELIEQLEATQAELVAAERREGILEERQRLAREIHDTLAQGFTSIVMHLEAAEQALPNDPGGAHKHIDRARLTARASLDEARRVVQDLRPDLLEQDSLPGAIERAAARWRVESGLEVTTSITGDPVPLHPNIEVTLLRAAQEALNNVRKHAQATEAQLTLSYMPDTIILDVQDNGVGLAGAEPSPFSGGYGLQAMRERAALCDGFVTLESDPGEGTTVVVSIPLGGSTPEASAKFGEIDI